MEEEDEKPQRKSGPVDLSPLYDNFEELAKRRIPKAATSKYKIGVNHNPDRDVAHYYPYFKDGQHVANKVRKRSEKKFYWEGEKDAINSCELYGQHMFEPGSAKAITLVEGELDAASAWVLLGSRYPVVSVLSAGTAPRDVKNNYEYLNSFDTIVINFDSDSAKVNPLTGQVTYPGQDAAKKVAAMFAPGKCRILSLKEGKDANDYLREGKGKLYSTEWFQAPAFMPDGLKIGKDMWDEITNRPSHFTVNYPFEGLNKFTYGMRLSELVVITAETGVGKTSVLKEIEYALLMNEELKEKGYGVGFLHLEEPNHDTALGLMSIHNNKPYHLPDTERTVEELRSAYDACINNDRTVLWDHFGSNTVQAVLEKVRHMYALGCRYIVLDHLSIVVSDQSGDERKQLDEITTKLKTLCMELNIALLCVIHQNRQGQIRGTAGVEQLANMVIKLHRERTDPDPWRRNVTKLIIEKNRFCGRAGPACYLFYNEITNRMEELTPEQVVTYEDGGRMNDDDIPF